MFTTVVCSLSGVLWHDQPVRERVLQELLLQENLSPRRRHPWYLGGSDRAFLRQVWDSYGRSLTDDYLTHLVQRFQQQYFQAMQALPQLPWRPDALAFLQQAQQRGHHLGWQTDCLPVLGLVQQIGIWGFHIPHDQALTDPDRTLVVESSRQGLLQAKARGAWVLGVASQMPFHWVQRHAHWVVDTLADWDWTRLPGPRAPAVPPAPAAADAETRTELPR